jgi:uncharacterized membrane protein
MSLPKDAELYLRRVSQGLSTLGTTERDEIVDELRSHLAERQAAGRSDLLAGFESPEALAASFVQERELRGALARGTSWALGRALLVAARDSVLALVVLLPLVLLQLIGGALIVMAVIKLFDPGKVGLWVGEGQLVLGFPSQTTGLRELLGWSAIPAFIVSGLVLLVGSNRVMRALVRWRLRARPQDGRAREG